MAEGRHQPSSRRIKPAFLIAGGIGALVVIAGILILATGGSDSPLVPGDHSMAPTPAFSFKVSKTLAVTTMPKADKMQAEQAAKPAAANAQKMLHDLYSAAFLDPDNWSNASYDTAFAAFSDGAKAHAMKQVNVLTAGNAAGDTYSDIQPDKATMRTKVLMDLKNQPYATVGTVTFTATATKKDGSGAVMLVSKGQYILQKAGNGWAITAFSVDRQDTPVKVKTPASGSSPTAGAS